MDTRRRAGALTACAMLAFASNSILCRLALRDGAIDAAGFTALRLASGAASLAIVARIMRAPRPERRRLAPALSLFAYAAAFSFAYLRLGAAVGALILFGMVQVSMVGIGLVQGQRPGGRQWAGLGLAIAGLLALTLPQADAPDLLGAALMALAGIAWGVYSVLGRGAGDPTARAAESFLLSLPLAALLAVIFLGSLHASPRGVALAVASGALASGLGYALWYAALRELQAIEAALVQLSVPVLAALASAYLLGEVIGPRFLFSATAILGGIAITLTARPD